MTNTLVAKQYRVGDWLIDCDQRLIINGEIQKALPAKVFNVLLLLITHAGKTVTREQLIADVWNGNELIANRGIINAMCQLRKYLALDESDSNGIKTIRKKGYQLTLPVSVVGDTKNTTSWSIKITLIGLLVAILLTGLYLTSTISDENETQFQQNIKRMTSFEGVEESPSFSPDGRYLAFHWGRMNQNDKIYIKDLKQQDAPLRLLSNDNHTESHPTWSPDQKYIAYYQIAANKQCSLIIIQLETEVGKKASDSCFVTKNYNKSIAFSPVGDKLAFIKNVNNIAKIAILDLVSMQETIITNPDKGQRDIQVVWQDNHNLIFVRDFGERSDLFSINIDPKTPRTERRLTSYNLPIYSIAWHAQEKRVYFNILRDGSTQIRAIQLDSKNDQLITRQKDMTAIAYSAHNKFGFTQYTAQEYIEVISAQDGKLVNRLSSSFRDLYGNWMPALNSMLFHSQRSGNWEVWLNDGTQTRQLTDNLGLLHMSIASPVDDLFAVPIELHGESHYSLFIGSITANTFEKAEGISGNVQNLSWSKDGKTIYFTRQSDNSDWNVFAYHLASKSVSQITNFGARYAMDDGNEHLILTRDTRPGLWSFDMTTQQLLLLTDELQTQDWGGYAPTKDGVYYIYRSADSNQIRFLSNNGDKHTVLDYPSDTIKANRGISLGKDDTLIISTVGKFEADIFILESVQQVIKN